MDLGLGNGHAHQGNPVDVRHKIQIVANVHRGHEEAQILRKLLTNPLDPTEQLPTLGFVYQRNQAVAYLQPDNVHRGHVIPSELAGFSRRRQCLPLATRTIRRDFRTLPGRTTSHAATANKTTFILNRLLLFLPDKPGCASGQQTKAEKRDVGHPRNQAKQNQDTGRNAQRFGSAEHLLNDLATHVLAGRYPGNHDGGRRGEQQRGNLGNQTITDGQQGITLHCQTKIQPVLHHADSHTTNDVDRQDQQPRNGIAFHKLRGAVHRTVKVRFLSDFRTA